MSKPSDTKSRLHPRSKHRQRYDFKRLVTSTPALASYVSVNKYGDESIDFFNPEAVKMLNRALLMEHYQIDNWELPEGYLCPPIPGRADYIHNVADLLAGFKNDNIPKGEKIKCLDVGVGANCIYPIIGNREYGWSFVGSDIDTRAISSAEKIVSENDLLRDHLELRLQPDDKAIFQNVIQKDEYFDLTICNPPFHKSAADAQAATTRKLRNLKKTQKVKTRLNFGGTSNELWYKGGEVEFIRLMINESKMFSQNCLWFTTLVSREEHLSQIYDMLDSAKAHTIETISMGQGQKISRIVAWTFRII